MAHIPKTVLVVEDSPVQASALVQFLKQMGLQVVHAFNGRLGIEMAEQVDPDLILLDVLMPEMDGYEACRRLKENPQTAEIPVVMLTVHTEPGSAQRGIEEGAVEYIPKDAFSYTVLEETLRQLLDLEQSESTDGIAGG
jgi:CheY-like chemotaxis protein